MPAINDFKNLTKGFTSPGDHFWSIAPNDSVDLDTVTRAINVSATGPVKVTTVGGEVVVIFVSAGVAFPGLFTRVWATGTAAGTIVGIR